MPASYTRSLISPRTLLAVSAVAVLAWWLWPDNAAAPTPDFAAPAATRYSVADRSSQFPLMDLDLLSVAQDHNTSSALIEVDRKRARYVVGQELAGGVRVQHIAKDQVVLVYGTAQRVLHLQVTPLLPGPVDASAQEVAAQDVEVRQRNARIDVNRLTVARLKSADTFLSEVHVVPNPRGGYQVESVLAESRYDKMGLRPGDIIYSLDTPKMAAVDEGSMIALMQQTEIELDIYRAGVPMRLQRHLGNDDKPEPK